MTMSTTTHARTLVAAVGALAILAAGCGDGTTDLPDLPDAEPTEEPDVAGDPDPLTGDDPDGGVLDEPLEEDDESAAVPVVTASPSAPAASKPAASKPPASKPAAKPVASPTKAALADGTYEGRLVAIDRNTVTLDLIRILSGDEALKAAAAAGALDPDGTLPNDVFVQELGKRVTLTIAGDGGFQVYDCSAGCALVGTTLDALVTGSGSPYGGAAAPFTFQVDGGSVISLVEVYLP
jgi:hypothetical protein